MSLRTFLLAPAVLSIAACATPLPPSASGRCDADAASDFVGRSATADNVEAARDAAGADMVRTLSPGQVVTMEYREGRLNLHIDAGRTITRITCG